jgi:hypothetical protein
MYDFRNRSKDHYSHEAARQKRSLLSEQSKSDLLCYRDDRRLLHCLIDTYSLWISKKEQIDRVKEMEVNLLKVDQECALLLERTNWDLQYLAKSNDDPFRHDSHQFRVEHKFF